MHPWAEWEPLEQAVQLRFAVRAIEADRLPLAGADRRPPKPLEMSLAGEAAEAAASALTRSLTSDSGAPSGTFNSNSTRNSIVSSFGAGNLFLAANSALVPLLGRRSPSAPCQSLEHFETPRRVMVFLSRIARQHPGVNSPGVRNARSYFAPSR
jgi:hypothetical protein